MKTRAVQAPPPRIRDRRLGLYVWAFVFLGVALTTGRLHVRGDATQMCAVAEALVERGSFDIAGGRSDLIEGPDGLRYSKYPLLTVLQCVPMRRLSAAGRSIDDAIEGPGRAFEFLGMGLVPAFVTAFVALFLLLLSRELGFSRSVSAFAGLAVVFTTPVWAYGREYYSENLQAALLLATLWVSRRAIRTSRARWVIAAGATCGLLLLAKFPLIVVPGFLLLMLATEDLSRRQWIRFIALGFVGMLPFLLAFLAYNSLRFGDVLEQGYADDRTRLIGFGTPLYVGLHMLLLSPGKSIFLYAPLLVVALWGVRTMVRQHRGTTYFAGGLFAFLLVTMSMWWAGHGDWGWGPRLVVPAMPLLFVFLLPVLTRDEAWRRTAVGCAAALGFVVNLLGIVIDHSHYLWVVSRVTQRGIFLGQSASMLRDDLAIAHFVPDFSPPLGHLWLLDNYVRGWRSGDWTPWKNNPIPAWEVNFDPTPPFLNFWADGSDAAWSASFFAALVLVGLLVGIVRQCRAEARLRRPALRQPALA